MKKRATYLLLVYAVIINIYRLLKKRLTTEDYQRIERNKLFSSRSREAWYNNWKKLRMLC